MPFGAAKKKNKVLIKKKKARRKEGGKTKVKDSRVLRNATKSEYFKIHFVVIHPAAHTRFMYFSVWIYGWEFLKYIYSSLHLWLV